MSDSRRWLDVEDRSQMIEQEIDEILLEEALLKARQQLSEEACNFESDKKCA